MEETKVYERNEFSDALALETILEVAQILRKRGYQPINQIVGYLMSGDPGYITSYENARKLILQFDRIKLLEVLVREVIKCEH